MQRTQKHPGRIGELLVLAIAALGVYLVFMITNGNVGPLIQGIH